MLLYNNIMCGNTPSDFLSLAVDCVGTFSQFSPCTASCGGGTQTAVFTITTHALFGGKACAHANGELVIQACNVDNCPFTGKLCLLQTRRLLNNSIMHFSVAFYPHCRRSFVHWP